MNVLFIVCGEEASNVLSSEDIRVLSNVLFVTYGGNASDGLCWKVLPNGDDRDLLNVLFIAYDGEASNVLFKV